MESDILLKLDEQGKKLDAMLRTVGRLNAYFKWTLVLTVLLVVVPLVALAFVIPRFMAPYLGAFNF